MLSSRDRVEVDTFLAFALPILALVGVVVLLAVLHWALRELGWWVW